MHLLLHDRLPDEMDLQPNISAWETGSKESVKNWVSGNLGLGGDSICMDK